MNIQGGKPKRDRLGGRGIKKQDRMGSSVEGSGKSKEGVGDIGEESEMTSWSSRKRNGRERERCDGTGK